MTVAGNQGQPPLSETSSTSGSTPFDSLRDGLAVDASFRAEVERALFINVNRVNPSDRGNRFITGGAVEWIVAAAAWHCGVLTVPGGHSENGFDLLDLQSAARGLWSVKSQTAASSGEFRISNGLGGGGRGFADPTVFLSPHLPGLVFAHPEIHLDVTAGQRAKKDAFVMPFRIIKAHAQQNPQCVAPLNVAMNEGRGSENPFLAYTKTILAPEQFPLLSKMFVAAVPATRTISDEIQKLAELRDAGVMSNEQFDYLLTRVFI